MNKLTKCELNNFADKWSNAYRGDYNGREVSIEIIRSLFNYGFTEFEAEEIYRSKHLRWFFDSQGGNVKKKDAALLFTKYLNRNIHHIKGIFQEELNHKVNL